MYLLLDWERIVMALGQVKTSQPADVADLYGAVCKHSPFK